MSESLDNPQYGVSVLVFTRNEEENLPFCLDSLRWCDDVTVVDSYSTDATLDICAARNICAVQRTFEGFGTTRNWALETLPLKHDWVLILDADERVPSGLPEELRELSKNSRDDVGAYRIARRFHMWGKWLRYSSLYPTWVVRFVHRRRVRFVNRGHAETQIVEGETGVIKGYLIDENHKGLDAWFKRQNRYSRQDAEYELETEEHPIRWASLFLSDPLERRAVFKRLAARLPFRGSMYFIYCYVLRLGFLDGRKGLKFCRMRALYQTMVSLKKDDIRDR